VGARPATRLTPRRPWKAPLSAAPHAQDALLAAGVLGLDLLTQWNPGAADRVIGHGPMPWPYVVGYAVAGVVALTWRRSWPAPVFAVLLVHSVVGTLFLPGYRPSLGVLVAFYTVASRTSLGWSLAALAAIGVPSGLAVLDEIQENPPSLRQSTLVAGTILYFLLDLAVWTAGRWVRRSRHDLSDAEKRRQAAAAAAVAEERGRIARELHDIVAHSVTIMVLQAAGARRVIRADPQVERALADIEACGRQAMADMRRLLRLLATSGTYAGEDVAELEPHPGLADLPLVIGRVQAAGIPLVEVRVAKVRVAKVRVAKVRAVEMVRAVEISAAEVRVAEPSVAPAHDGSAASRAVTRSMSAAAAARRPRMPSTTAVGAFSTNFGLPSFFSAASSSFCAAARSRPNRARSAATSIAPEVSSSTCTAPPGSATSTVAVGANPSAGASSRASDRSAVSGPAA